MKILLLTTPWSYYELKNPGCRSPRILKKSKDVSGQGIMFPYGLLQQASALKAAGNEVGFIDGYMKDERGIVDWAFNEKPQAIGISSPTALWEKTKMIIRKLKEVLPDSFLFFGGPHALFAKEKCLKESPGLDAVITGEEESLCGLIKNIEPGLGLADIKGVILRGNADSPDNNNRCYMPDINKLPLPDYKLVRFSDYTPNLNFLRKKPFAHMFTSRGCSHKCAFCAYPRNNPVRFKSPGYLIKEIEYLVSLGVKTINFYDDCNIFSHNEEQGLILCDLLKKRSKSLRWSVYLVNFFISEKILKKMKESGCFRINCCVESGVQKNIDIIRGEHVPLDRIAGKIKEINKIGISSCGRFQFGIPGETYEEGLKTIEFAASLPIDYAYFVRALISPGSGLFDIYMKTGRINPDTRTWSAYSEFFNPDGMSLKELSVLIRKGYQRFYFRPRWWLNKMLKPENYGAYIGYVKRIKNII